MSQFAWEPEVMEETQQPQQPEQPAVEPGTLALSVDDFSALEDRILRAVSLVKRERTARATAEEQVSIVEAQLSEQKTAAEQLQGEVKQLRDERDHVRQRVERLLAQLDALEL